MGPLRRLGRRFINHTTKPINWQTMPGSTIGGVAIGGTLGHYIAENHGMMIGIVISALFCLAFFSRLNK